MMVHVECLPDETLIMVLGGTRKSVTHHMSKSRVFSQLKKVKDHIAMVDEDPRSPKTTYEKQLRLVETNAGVTVLEDTSKNRVCILKGKLEDWMIQVCQKSGINMEVYNLPSRPNELHRVINDRLTSLKKLIQHLLEVKNPDILYLKSRLGL